MAPARIASGNIGGGSRERAIADTLGREETIAMIKRFLDSFVQAGSWGSGAILGGRGADDLSSWSSAGSGETVQDRELRASAAPDHKTNENDDADDTGDRTTPTGGYNRISLEIRAAQYAVERKATGPRFIRVCCTRCDNPVRVEPKTEIAHCPACSMRFRVDRAKRN